MDCKKIFGPAPDLIDKSANGWGEWQMHAMNGKRCYEADNAGNTGVMLWIGRNILVLRKIDALGMKSVITKEIS
jgi:hypothetical protein